MIAEIKQICIFVAMKSIPMRYCVRTGMNIEEKI